jgi:phenylacetate-coenzyme A ligase PaaK-like adenylate-forming protein
MVTLVTEEADTLLRQRLCSQQILVRSNYSSEELGYIGTECEFFPEHYHVTHSNVIVEVDPDDTISVNSSKLGRVLVTHLHSYATPFIRYDIGDFATLSDGCKCGHNGPTLTNIVGQQKRLLKRQDGSVATFSMKAGNILKIVECEEYRIRQTGVTIIELELGGLDSISPNQADALTKLFKKYAGDEFEIRIRAVPRIDWGQDRKKLGFRSELF